MKAKQNKKSIQSKNEDQIRTKAYYLWIEAGRPMGRSDEFWYTAVAAEKYPQAHKKSA